MRPRSPLSQKFSYHLSSLHHLFEFCVWHLKSSPVNHSDIQFSKIDDLPQAFHFYLGWCPFLFLYIPDFHLPLCDIANYFKLSGRHFQFQLNLVLCTDLEVDGGMTLTALDTSTGSYGDHLPRNLNLSCTGLMNTHCIYTVKTEDCLVVFQQHTSCDNWERPN